MERVCTRGTLERTAHAVCYTTKLDVNLLSSSGDSAPFPFFALACGEGRGLPPPPSSPETHQDMEYMCTRSDDR